MQLERCVGNLSSLFFIDDVKTHMVEEIPYQQVTCMVAGTGNLVDVEILRYW